jgi:hypothetical protein
LDLSISDEVLTKSEVLSSLVIGNLNEWGVGEPKKGKSSKLSSLHHLTISGDERKSKLSRLSSFNSG